MRVNEVVRFLWMKLHLPPKRIVVYPSIQAAIDNASKWRHTVVLLKEGVYPADTITVCPYVNIAGATKGGHSPTSNGL